MSLFMDIRKDLGSFRLHIQLEAKNEPVALLGASGSGKSLTLGCIAGTVKPDEGQIVLDGVTLFDAEKKIDLPPQQRHVGLLFQRYALFPNMTVAQNAQLALRRTVKGAARQARVAETLDALHLSGLENRLPSQLSGGQQQRVALARILLSEPRILMLDEPFSALDSFLRWQMEQYMADIIERFAGTTLLVSHNRDEAYHLCRSIAVVADGKIDACGTREALFREPRTQAAALLTGCKNIAAAQPRGEGVLFVPDWNLTLHAAAAVEGSAVGIRARQLVRDGVENRFTATVERVIEGPFSTIFMLRPDGATTLLRWEVIAPQQLRVGERVTLSIPAERVLVLR